MSVIHDASTSPKQLFINLKAQPTRATPPTLHTSTHTPNSPVSQNSQEEISEEEEEGAVKGEEMELGDGGASKLPEGDAPQEEDGPPQASGKGAGRGRGKS